MARCIQPLRDPRWDALLQAHPRASIFHSSAWLSSLSRTYQYELRFFDFGRTDADQQGLITFKDRWGATQSVVTYSRYSVSEQGAHVFDLSAARWKSRAAKYMLATCRWARYPRSAGCSTDTLDRTQPILGAF